MDHDDEHQETPCSLPVIARLDRLDRLVQLLEEKKRSLSRRDFCGVESEDECKTLSSALEEVKCKGTLIERLSILEKRVLQLSLEIDEGNTTSRSSSSTVQGSTMNAKNDSGLEMKDENEDAINKQQKDPSKIQAQENASPADGVVKKIAASPKSRRQKTKPQKKWPWLFRHTC